MDNVVAGEGLWQFSERLGFESEAAYGASPFSAFSRDFSARFSRDPQAQPKPDEILIDPTWRIAVPKDLSPLGQRMAKDLAEFMRKSMGTALDESFLPRTEVEAGPAKTIALLDKGGGEEKIAESFTITVKTKQIIVAGRDAAGLRDGVVHLVDQMGFRQAPIVSMGAQTYTPRLAVRLGATPYLGSAREAVFLGCNAVFIDGAQLWEVSTSDAISELAGRRRGDLLAKTIKQGQEAGEYGLKCYMRLSTQQKFSKEDPVFQKYPDIRGAQVRGGPYILCTEHPLVKKYMADSFQKLFRDIPQLAGVVIIIGGEGFYHCYMHAIIKCPRCEKLGAETVVANLCNNLAAAVREVNPAGEVIAWPYSAVHVWSAADPDQAQLIAKLKPGTAILTEVEKDEYVGKPDGVNKHLWDYSIDMVGLGGRATRQLAACKKAGIPIYFKSEPELSFEAPRLPHVPCLDRWFGRATAIAASGASGMFNFPAFRSNYGTSAAEIYKYACWNPPPKAEDILQQLAARIAGPEGGPHLRNAWKFASDAIAFSPELPPYYTGPYYLGPAHPMCANPAASLPAVFKGRYLFQGDGNDAEGLALRPTFFTSPRGNVPVFGKMYREMENRLKLAADEVKAAEPRVPERCRLVFRAEASSILWFYATARAHANFYEACQLRDQFRSLAQSDPIAREKLEPVYDRWLEVLKDERQNATEALPLAETDMRLDCYYGLDHCFSHMADMVQAKLKIIDGEINAYLPSLRQAAGLK